ncbi:MAG: Tfp pilus assembly protein FimT/FimU [Akkermansiaceae bacterium]
MTSPPKTSRSTYRSVPPAFTLLEIIVVLAIAGLIVGGSITVLLLTSSERILRKTSTEIELLAKKARSASILRQRPYVIEFHPGSVKLMPLSDTGFYSEPIEFEPDGGAEKSYQPLREEIPINPKIVLSMRPWNTENFIIPTETLTPVWRFDPDGLSEPITVRLNIGNSYAQDTYHPLTATITDSELEAN